MRIAAVVITYNPDIQAFISNLKAYLPYVDKVLIWRNSFEEYELTDDIEEKVVYCGERKNEYIAKALNYALEWCVDNDYDYLLTMDQDSEWMNCDQFIKKALCYSRDDVAIYAPNVNMQYSEMAKDLSVESVITSGSLCNVRIANGLGGFRNDYEIYWVDGEFCHWAKINGYDIVVLPDCHLKQQFGRKTKTLFGFKTSNYSPLIYYYLIRNMIWMKREYRVNPSWKCVLYTLFINTRGIVLGEKNKLRKLYMIIKAIIHGCFNRYDSRTR